MIKVKHLIVLIIFCAAFSACTANSGVLISRQDDDMHLHSVAICPIQLAKPEEVQVRIGSQHNIPPALFRLHAGNGGAEKQDILTKILEEKFINDGRLQIVPALKTANALAALVAGNSMLSLSEAVQRAGSSLNVEAVLVGYLYNWQELEGSWYAAKKPASVAFELHLHRVKDGEIIWRALFDDTQGSLTDDLFSIGDFIKRGGRWISAAELVQDGVEEIAAELSR